MLRLLFLFISQTKPNISKMSFYQLDVSVWYVYSMRFSFFFFFFIVILWLFAKSAVKLILLCLVGKGKIKCLQRAMTMGKVNQKSVCAQGKETESEWNKCANLPQSPIICDNCKHHLCVSARCFNGATWMKRWILYFRTNSTFHVACAPVSFFH